MKRSAWQPVTMHHDQDATTILLSISQDTSAFDTQRKQQSS